MVSGPRKARLRKVTFYVVDIVVDHYEDFIYSSQMTVHSVNPFSSTKKATHFLQDSQFQSTKTNNIYSKLHTQFHFPKYHNSQLVAILLPTVVCTLKSLQ